MFFVVRVRGTTGVKKDVANTLNMLRLNKINHGVIIQNNPSYKGMLQKVKDYITWGEVKPEVLKDVISKRGKLIGNIAITEEYIKENTDCSSIEELTDALLNSEIKAEDIDMKPVFRLHPPRKGYEGVRQSFNEGGSLGFRGNFINTLLKRMI
ncbi:MAG: 50S ribosomal protein L30 [Methanobrevibacter sp.]|jgi:large subunit ribosomal protein L30|nr:50S ribosomal protein L30 [Candidatus Methanovirga basalitermitum]